MLNESMINEIANDLLLKNDGNANNKRNKLKTKW